MADQQLREGSSTSNVSGGNSESIVELHIKTLDSRIYSFQVDKNIEILAFKEKIAAQSGVPVAQQRLIFRGKVLKDGHLLSEYNVENGDSLHLVERQPQPSLGSGIGEAMPSNVGSIGQDSAAGNSRGRIGQIAHSVVLGTVNVGDSGEAVVPDLSRVIGAVLNSIGIGNLAAGMQPNVQVQTSQGHETEGSQANNGSQSRGGNQSIPWQSMNGQANAIPIPLGAMVAVPSLSMPIPDSLNTLTEYMNRLGLALSENVDQHNQSPAATGDLPTIELPTNARGVPTVEALSIVLRHAQRLLNDNAVAALSRSAGRLEQEGASSDPTVRGQVQTELMRLGVAMQHLGSLFLELGRTILTLRMGQSQAESFVNAGPAVYISPIGPNPIMVQPFPLQTSPLFSGQTSIASNPMAMGPVGVGNAPRNVNIHIHTGASLVPMVPPDNREGLQGERASGSDSGPARFLSGLNVTATAVPSRPAVVSSSGPIQLGVGVSQPPESSSAVATEFNAQARNLVANILSGNHVPLDGLSGQRQPVDSGARNDATAGSGVVDAGQTLLHEKSGQKEQPEFQQPHAMNLLNSNDEPSTSAKGSSHNLPRTTEHTENLEGPTRPNEQNDNIDGSTGVPLGLGLGGLQPKRRDRQRAQAKNGNFATASTQNQQARAVGQHVLQSLASLPSRRNENISAPGQSPDHSRGVIGSTSAARENADGPVDVANAMSEVLQSPALDGLLAGVSRQTGIGSPDMMRNMLQQFTQNPAMRNTMNQIAQQIDTHDLGSMFAGIGGGQGGGIDLGSMMQQMMPIVSQALGGVSSTSQRSIVTEPDTRSGRETTPIRINNQQIDIQPVVQTLESRSTPEEIFRSLAGTAVGVFGDPSAGERIINDVCSQEGLVQEFVEMLRRDVSGRLEDDKRS
ncbi:hypothetical protein F511_32540 [Dorcoceras hygrometricum]|uniref:Ubiquitin-like domain-containing protein n=1 Tax=Dorcoceras hygrometricum TaxID=472368 RepID=A0A2Z7A0K3_9LAMI|nr:hypothetical protein F511_32540 [Dorcoceras hygrometricum]